MRELINKKAAIESIAVELCASCFYSPNSRNCEACEIQDTINVLKKVPTAQIALDDVLTYIDGLDETGWQEFTSCLECRGYSIENNKRYWCGGSFA